MAHAFDKKYGLPKAGQPSVWQQILGLVTILLLNGLESNISVWIFAQSPFLKSLYFDDSAIRDQFAYCCLGNPTKGYGLIEKSISSPHIIPASYRKELAEALKFFKDQELWSCLTTYGGQYLLQETPWIDPTIKWTRLFYGELDLDSLLQDTAEDEDEQLLLSEAELPPLSPSTPNESNLIRFPDGKTGPKLSPAALKLLNFARRRGCRFRLQEAQNRLGKYGKAEIVLTAAQECVAAGLGVLEENLRYPNSYYFDLVGDDDENDEDNGQKNEETSYQDGEF
jgi:hypothetical protein